MKTLIALALLWFICLFPLKAQNFQNSDLIGTINGSSCMPTGWQPIPFTDPHCMAGLSATATADLTSPSLPSPFNGVIGQPPSGQTFISGEQCLTTMGHIYHEGIQQTVSGFVPGHTYQIQFQQAVVKTRYSVDTSGSWAVILNDSLVGITQPSTSYLNFSDPALNWDNRSLSFEAWQSTFTIKFLPWDDDTVHLASPRTRNGGLRMGIDMIQINGGMALSRPEPTPQPKVIVFPNPTTDQVTLQAQVDSPTSAELIDMQGKVVQFMEVTPGEDLTIPLLGSAGQYFIRMEDQVISVRKQ